jgi:hypothetical protein
MTQNDRAQGGVAQIAGKHGLALAQDAARGDAVDQLGDMSRFEDLALPVVVAGVVRELHRVDPPDLEAQALQGKGRRRVADMAIGDVRLDREDGHRWGCGSAWAVTLPQAAQ